MEQDELRERLESAIVRRAALIESLGDGEPCYRIVHGDADGLDGLTVDRYGEVALVEQHLVRADPKPLIEALRQRLPELSSVVLKRRFSREHDALSGEVVAGAPIAEELVVDEGELRYSVHLTQGEHTGLFLDSRSARRAVCRRAAGRRVLNLFSYTGGFGVVAAEAGATSTTNVDVRRSALAGAARNYDLNGLAHDSRTFMADDAIRFLNRMARGRGRFDLVIVDPPPRFRRKGGRRFDARESYGRLIARCLRVLEPSGLLLAGLNARAVSDADYRRQIDEGAALAERQLEQVEIIEPDADFPQATGRPRARFTLWRGA